MPAKGPRAYATVWLCAFLRGAGSQAYKLHCDAEAAITSLAEAAVHELGNGDFVVRAPVGSHQSIGAVEMYHADLHGHIKTQIKTNYYRVVFLFIFVEL